LLFFCAYLYYSTTSLIWIYTYNVMIPEQNPDHHPRGLRTAFLQARILAINFLGFAGIVLMIYGVAVYFTGEEYKFLELAAQATANISTLLGVALTASSVWLPTNTREPDDFSIFISAPIVVATTVLVLVVYLVPSTLIWLVSLIGFKGNSTIPPHIFNGFAILGLAGGLFRTVSR